MQRMTFEAFWDAANVALAYRDAPQMLFGDARTAYAQYLEDWAARNKPDVATILPDDACGGLEEFTE